MMFFTLLGILFCPVFTLGCVLVHYDHPLLGILAIAISLLRGAKKSYIEFYPKK